MSPTPVTAFAPGRVNIMGDHTDYAGGLALPMAIDLGTTVTGRRGGDEVVLESDQLEGVARVPIDLDEPARVEPGWPRYVAAVVAELRPAEGLTGTVTSTLPVGAGLSSSASLAVALALALGFDGPPRELADRARAAEQRATGVPCGLLDQLAVTLAQAGHTLRIDFTTLEAMPVPLPADIEVLVVHSGEARSLAGSAYAEREAQVAAATRILGPLARASVDDLATLADPILRRRARHVISECARVDQLASALAAGDRAAVSEVMAASHRSLAEDFEVSTPALDQLVAELAATPGVIGARLTGAGFGGCVVALAEPGTRLPDGRRAWRVRPAGGPQVTSG